MVKRDTSSAFTNEWKPGVYLAQVKSVEVKSSSTNGDKYLNLCFGAVDFEGQTLCFDIAMLEGRGRGIGTKKLEALGVPTDQDEFEEAALVGVRVYVNLVEETYEGEARMKVNIKPKDSYCGYWPESEKPDGVITELEPKKEGYQIEDDPIGQMLKADIVEAKGKIDDDTPF